MNSASPSTSSNWKITPRARSSVHTRLNSIPPSPAAAAFLATVPQLYMSCGFARKPVTPPPRPESAERGDRIVNA